MRSAHSYAPKGSADWKFTLGSLESTLKGLEPGAALRISWLETVCIWRVWPRPNTTISPSSDGSAAAVWIGRSAACDAESAASVGVVVWARAAPARARAARAAPACSRRRIAHPPSFGVGEP